MADDKYEIEDIAPLPPQNDKQNLPRVVTAEGLAPIPTGRLRLTTVANCQKELARVYKSVRSGEMPTYVATRLAYLLITLSNMIRDGALEDRIAKLEAEINRNG